MFFFSPWTSKKCPWTILQKCPWTRKSARETSETLLPVNPKKCPWTEKKCPWTLKVPVNIFNKKCPWTWEICPWTCEKAAKTQKIQHFYVFWGKSTREPRKVPVKFFQNWCPWTMKSAREKGQKSAREGMHLRVNFPEKVPVNAKKCPWKFSKKRRSRALLRFTGKKKHCIYKIYCI